MKITTTKEKTISILASNRNTFLTCRNIQRLIHSKWGKMPPDGTLSAILYKLTQNNITERRENIGCKKGYGYKLLKNEPIEILEPKPNVTNSIMELEI
jgi:hypothetical protein